MNKIYPTLPVWGDCYVLFPSNSSIFHFFHISGAKRSGFETHGGQWFLNSNNCAWTFWGVLEMYLKKASLFLNTLMNSKFSNKVSPQTQKNQENFSGNYFSPSTYGKHQSICLWNLGHSIMLNLEIFFDFLLQSGFKIRIIHRLVIICALF